MYKSLIGIKGGLITAELDHMAISLSKHLTQAAKHLDQKVGVISNCLENMKI